MKNGKRFAAILGIVLLLAVFCTPMVFALSGKEFNMGYFFSALAAAFFVPVIVFIMMEVHRIFVKKNDGKADSTKADRMVDNVIFDVGQVLVKFDWKRLMDEMQFQGEKRRKIEAAIFGSRIWDERDRGLYEEAHYVDEMVKLAPEYEEDIREFMRRSPETISKMDYAVSWVKYLKRQGYHLYVLSNYCAYMKDANRECMEWLRYMDGTAFSCDVKELKPEKEIYQKLLDMYELDPKRSVFIDDRQENLDGAKKVGIGTVLFKDFRQAAKELEMKFGVK